MNSNHIPQLRPERNMAIKVAEEAGHILILPLYIAGVFAVAVLVALVLVPMVVFVQMFIQSS